MTSRYDKKAASLEDILRKLEADRYHGNITIHYTHGKPRKIEYKTMEDLD
ncbi:hypothetical protein [Geomesophilobacter sediminis]|uniref:Uncharacterized protein n=1 Tax=Geomesophilobacter sediminis TaxID=2798584 RepID=A0A8J7S856_9BACT|nr:hypothetical protein [Geomesophilobacter sediminis]MBJ6727372.1 hypothetical protein [Geomesophilobacter sediminis]